MPILVTCPGCKAQFNVSEKFAGKKGPCPKCKAVILIPAAPVPAAAAAAPAGAKSSAAAPAGKPPAPAAADVKIHGLEEGMKTGGEKGKTGKVDLKPIFHHDVRLTWKLGLMVLGTTAALFIAAWFVGGLNGGKLVREPEPLLSSQQGAAELVSARRIQLIVVYALRAVGLVLIGLPIVIGGYAALRDDELEPFRGRSLLIRSLICLAVYIAVWGLYALIPDDMATQLYLWIFWAPLLVLPAAAAAYFCFDLDYLGASMHALFFFVVTVMLGLTAGLSLPWNPTASAVQSQPEPGTQIKVDYQY